MSQLPTVLLLLAAALFPRQCQAEPCETSFQKFERFLARKAELPASFSKGDAEISAMFSLARELRRRRPDPNSDHIPELAALAEKHLSFAKNALESQISPDLAERTALLHSFSEEARQRVAEGKVTYRWWVYFNFRLSILLTPAAKRGGEMDDFVKALHSSGKWKTNAGLEQTVAKFMRTGDFYGRRRTLAPFIDGFPDNVILPTVVGDIGVSALNRRFLSGVHPIGLIGKPIVADGKEMYPDHFFAHDIIHMKNEVTAIAVSYPAKDTERLRWLHERILLAVDALPAYRRRMVDFLYFLGTHELPFNATSILEGDGARFTDHLLRERREEILRNTMDKAWYAGLLPESVDSGNARAVENYLEECATELRQVVKQANGL